MNREEIAKRLKEPFAYNEIEWRVLNTTQDKSRGLAVAFLDARAVQRRLDDVLGIFNWRNEYVMWQNNAQICGLSIYDSEHGVWLTKYDGAENSDIEAIKGGLSDSFKRAAVLWGIGRYLYELGSIWVDIEPKGKSFSIKQDQYNKLEAEYNKAVTKIFGTTANKQDSPAASQNKLASPAPPAKQSKNNNLQSKAPSHDFKVKTVKPSGKTSQLLELVDGKGEIITAYIKSGNQDVKAGICLRNVNITRKDSSYGPYNLIDRYELAAA